MIQKTTFACNRAQRFRKFLCIGVRNTSFLFYQFDNSTLYSPHKIKNKQNRIYYPIKWCISDGLLYRLEKRTHLLIFLSDRIALKRLKIPFWFLEQKWSNQQLCVQPRPTLTSMLIDRNKKYRVFCFTSSTTQVFIFKTWPNIYNLLIGGNFAPSSWFLCYMLIFLHNNIIIIICSIILIK